MTTQEWALGGGGYGHWSGHQGSGYPRPRASRKAGHTVGTHPFLPQTFIEQLGLYRALGVPVLRGLLAPPGEDGCSTSQQSQSQVIPGEKRGMAATEPGGRKGGEGRTRTAGVGMLEPALQARRKVSQRGPASAKAWDTLADPSGLVLPQTVTYEELIVQWGSLRMLLEEMPGGDKC